ncbi:RHS repeat protein, partial [Pseudomonas sp. GM48]
RPGPTRMQGNRLRQRDDSHYDYDAFGNLIRERRGTPARVTDYRYDSQHRLIGVTTPDGTTASYRYDAFGRRIGKTVDGQTTHFFWQGDQLVAESGPKHYRSYLSNPAAFARWPCSTAKAGSTPARSTTSSTTSAPRRN